MQRAQQYWQYVCVFVYAGSSVSRAANWRRASFSIPPYIFHLRDRPFVPRPGNYAGFSAALRSHNRRGHGVLFLPLRPEVLPGSRSLCVSQASLYASLFEKESSILALESLETLLVQIFADACRYFSIQWWWKPSSWINVQTGIWIEHSCKTELNSRYLNVSVVFGDVEYFVKESCGRCSRDFEVHFFKSNRANGSLPFFVPIYHTQEN